MEPEHPRIEGRILLAWLADDYERAYALMQHMSLADLTTFQLALDGLQDAAGVVMDDLPIHVRKEVPM
jgi:hypothetical protein